MDTAKLVYMANQIGKFFAPRGEDAAVAGIADHLKRFWDPRMRAEITAYLQAGGTGLDAPVQKAVQWLQSKPSP
jgi:formate dehydrogenase subunit delta